jgi:hypothetical protein
MPFYLRTPDQPLGQDTIQDHILDKGKSKQAPEVLDKDNDKDKDTRTDQTLEATQDSMAPKSGYYESSRSSSDGDRIHHDPRKGRHSASKITTTKRPVEVHHHDTPSGEPKRPSSIDSKTWK